MLCRQRLEYECGGAQAEVAEKTGGSRKEGGKFSTQAQGEKTLSFASALGCDLLIFGLHSAVL